MSDLRRITDAPDDDSVLERHKFYNNVSIAIINNTEAMQNLTKNLEVALSGYNKSAREFAIFTARVNTVITMLGILWIGLSSGLGWYISRVVDANDKIIARVEKLERTDDANTALINLIRANAANAAKNVDNTAPVNPMPVTK